MSTTWNSAALWAACADGDESARDSLAREHMSLVHHVANRLMRQLAPDAEMDELLSAGRMGLFRAMETFDASRGLAFSTYAVPRIQGAILDELRKLDVLTRGTRARAREIAAARQQLASSLGRPPRQVEVASRLGVDVQVLWRWEAEVDASVPVAMNRPLRGTDSDGDACDAGELLLDMQGELPGERMERDEDVERLRVALGSLTEQERTVLALSYFEELKLHEIGEVLGVTDSRVSQIRSRALRRLRAMLEPEALSA